jgi:mannose-6-phosphate isomerase-like protein (cupin superfamily)
MTNKFNPQDRSPTSSEPGHVVRELIGLESMNVARYSVAHIVAEAGSHGITRQNQFDEILIVASGRGVARREYTSDELGPRDVLLLPAGTRYSIDAHEGEDLEMWAVCVPAYRPEWSNSGATKRDWRDYQVPRGAERLRPTRDSEE